MAAMTESSVVAGELERVDSYLPTLYDIDDLFYSQIVKATDAEHISSRDMRVPLDLRPGGNFGHFEPDGGDLGRGDGPVYAYGTIGSVYLKIGLEWTKKAEWSTDEKRKSVLNAFRIILAKSMEEFSRDSDALCMTDGTGVLANPNAVTVGGGTAGGDLWTVPVTDGFGVKLLRFNQTVGVYPTGLATKRGEAKINAFDLAARQVSTFPSIATAAATDKLVVSGLGAPPVSLFGVPYHQNNAATGTWLGLSRAANPEIRANRVTASGALALPFARVALNAAGNRFGKKNKMKVEAWMHPCQAAAYEELGQMVSVIQKTPSSNQGLDLYFGDNMQIAGVPIHTDFYWDKTRIDFIVKELWRRVETHAPGFYDVDGKRIFEGRGASGGVAAYQMIYVAAGWNLYTRNPGMGSYISDLSIPTGYA